MVTREEIEETYRLIEAAAIAGERCPKSRPFGPLYKPAVSELYRARRLKGEVYFHNWRCITLLDGPHAGKCTAPPPWGGRPYKIIDYRNFAAPPR